MVLMPRGSTASTLSLSERRETAFDLFMRGWTNKDIAEAIDVTPETVARYRKDYNDRISEAAASNPGLLAQVLENTIVLLEENAAVRKALWDEYEMAGEGRVFECEECGNEEDMPTPPNSVRIGILNSLTKAGEQRAKLFGLFGVKAEFFAQVQEVRSLQKDLIEFLTNELCQEDRDKVIAFLEGRGRAPQDLPAIPDSLIETTGEG
jgi:hypothetical protein